MEPRKFTIENNLGEMIFKGDLFWRTGENTARRATWADEYHSDNLLHAIESSNSNEVTCCNRNTIFIIEE